MCLGEKEQNSSLLHLAFPPLLSPLFHQLNLISPTVTKNILCIIVICFLICSQVLLL